MAEIYLKVKHSEYDNLIKRIEFLKGENNKLKKNIDVLEKKVADLEKSADTRTKKTDIKKGE